MKKKLFFLPFLTALAFAGCSNDDLAPGKTTDSETGDVRYLAVNIVAPKESANAPMGRAATNGGFQDGTADEDAVTSALFILLDNENKVHSTQTADLNPWHGMGSTSGSVENISSAVLVISAAETKPEVSGILAVLNPTDAIQTGITTGMTLAAVKEIVNDYSTTATHGKFVMTNSAYVEGSTERLAAAVTDSHLAATEKAAKNNPVEVYVERVVAKITTNAVADITTVGEGSFNKGAQVKMNGESAATDLKIDIRGIQIANSVQKSHLFKNISGFAASAPFLNWNDAANHRSYWANVPALTAADIENNSWNEISGVGEGNTARSLTAAQTFYAQENICNGGIGAGPGHTSVIVTAQLQKQNAQGTYDPFSFVKLANEYYTPDGALKQLVGYLNSRGYRVKTTTPSAEPGGQATITYKTLAENCLEWLTSAPTDATNVKGWEGFAQLKNDYAADESFVKYDAGSTAADKFVNVDAAAINSELKGEDFRALKWTNGYCYYFVDIEHFGTKAAEGTVSEQQLKGIIRNHIYSLNLQSLSGLGIPVFDPEVDIIPERPAEEQLFYLAARINILKWVVVGQNVNFN